MADGRERQVSGHQRLAVRRQLPQKTRLDGFTLRAFLFPFGALRVTGRRASGSGRSASPATGTGSRGEFALGIVSPGCKT
jgi:hypothetical protein